MINTVEPLMLPTLSEGPFVADRIDDEVIIVNLQSGIYYSLRKFGVDVWDALEAGRSEDELVTALCERHDLSEARATAAMQRLVQDLAREGIVTPNSMQAPVPADSTAAPEQDPHGLRLQRFSDMEELLMLDPVHDVDDAGWPMKPKQE